MDYPIIFVILMGLGTVFFGLICLIGLTTVMGKIMGQVAQAAPAVAASPARAAVPAPAEVNRPEMIAAVSAAIAEELGTDITGIRILSMKKL